jgi:hypothetical protein
MGEHAELRWLRAEMRALSEAGLRGLRVTKAYEDGAPERMAIIGRTG